MMFCLKNTFKGAFAISLLSTALFSIFVMAFIGSVSGDMIPAMAGKILVWHFYSWAVLYGITKILDIKSLKNITYVSTKRALFVGIIVSSFVMSAYFTIFVDNLFQYNHGNKMIVLEAILFFLCYYLGGYFLGFLIAKKSKSQD